jgi:hypothetical protein
LDLRFGGQFNDNATYVGNAMSQLKYSGSRYATFCQQVKALGSHQSTRQGPSKELTLTNFEVIPYDYIPAAQARKFNLGFGFAELASLLTGIDNIEVFTKHIGDYARFSTDGVRLDNSYGSRAATSIMRCLEILSNPDTEDARYAVATINRSSSDLWSKSAHVPCTLSIQWLVRDGKLHQQVNMRSNDVVKGVAYDVFSFGLLHMIMAQNLGLRVGLYVQTAGSLHAYAFDYKLIDNMTNDEPMLLDFENKFDFTDVGLLGQCLLSEDFSLLPDSWLKDIALASFARWDKTLFVQVSAGNRDVLSRTNFLDGKV